MKKRRPRQRINWRKIRWGTLTKWLLKHRRVIKKYCGDPFTKNGEINDRVLMCLYKNPAYLKQISKTRWRLIWRKIHFKLFVLKG